MPQVGAHGHKCAARLWLGNRPVAVQELRKTRGVVHAHDVGTGLDGAQAHAKRSGIALGGSATPETAPTKRLRDTAHMSG